MTDSTLAIGPKVVGAAHRPLVIAEMSGNHRGKLDEALRIVRAAASSGADAIKLQTFTPATLTIDSSRPEFFINDPGSLWHGRRLWELYDEAHTPWEWHEPLFAEARAHGMACISSVFDETSVQFLLEIGVDALKIASFELVHLPLIACAARSGKPLLVSTGMATLAEIDEAVETMRGNGCAGFVLLKCTSAYPAEEKDANVLTMPDLSSRYACHVGLSDHTLRHFTSLAAVALGASVIEKHVTLRRADGGVDSAFSLEPAELRELVEGTELVWRSRGVVTYGSLPAEETSRRERPSIFVVLPVKKGETLTSRHLRIIRPGDGLPPRDYALALGNPAACDIDAGTPLSWDLIDRNS